MERVHSETEQACIDCIEGVVFVERLTRRYRIAAVLTALAGCALHFLYELLPNPLTALISPINESVWEHLKLLYFPTLAAAAILARRSPRSNRIWGGFFAAILTMPVVLTGIFYLLKAGFCTESTMIDIALYFVTIFWGFRLAYRFADNGKAGAAAPWLLLPVALFGAALILFTFAAPALPLFAAP